jgi:hypothetical protein
MPIVNEQAAPAAQAEPDPGARPRRHRHRPRWKRIVGLALVIAIAWALLMIAGPGPFLVLAVIVFVVDLFLDRHRSAERRADLRARRRRGLERAIDAGGPSDEPTERHKSPDPNAAEGQLFGRRMSGLISGMWPRGRI